MTEIIITLIAAVLASNGLWAVINTFIVRRQNKKDERKNTDKADIEELKELLQQLEENNTLQKDMLRGLAHDRILCLGNEYIKRGYITPEEFDNLYQYIYLPAKALNINGSSKRIMDKVEGLPVKPNEE